MSINLSAIHPAILDPSTPQTLQPINLIYNFIHIKYEIIVKQTICKRSKITTKKTNRC